MNLKEQKRNKVTAKIWIPLMMKFRNFLKNFVVIRCKKTLMRLVSDIFKLVSHSLRTVQARLAVNPHTIRLLLKFYIHSLHSTSPEGA